ncbi:MAG: DUF362 domain-containing protein, partial [Burkholderiales bacterium]
MRRRDFLKGAAASPFLARAPKLRAQEPAPQPPAYQIVTPHKPSGNMGMPGLYPGRAVEVHSPASIDPATDRVGRDALARMVERGMTSLTGEKTAEAAWRKFFSAGDVVGLKINASGAPGCVSSPELVNEIIAGLRLAGVRPSNIYLYERYSQQVDLVGYQAWVPDGVQVVGAEFRSGDPSRYDSGVYVETNFFGEENRRSYMVRLVSQRFTKIVNIPNLKDHSASGVTGCLKNIAYGSFSNVARSHRNYQTHTRTFIGRLCTVEPLRSRTVLHVMDGLRGVWHGGPFAPNRRFLWHPQLLYFGTDPVAIDRLELE